MKRPTPLVRTFTENLMAYALGRRVEYFDQPTIRAITKKAEADNYQMSSFILGVVKSDPFRMKRVEAPATTADDSEAGRAVRGQGQTNHHSRGDADDVLHHRKAFAPPDLPPRRGRHRGIALPGRDGAGRPRVRRGRRPPSRTRLICIEEVHGLAGCNNWAATKYLFAPEQVGPQLHAGRRTTR